MSDRADDLLAVMAPPFDAGRGSFLDALRRHAPDALPTAVSGQSVPAELRAKLVEGTTVLAAVATDGVVVAGDRRATAGNIISRGDMRKVFRADHWSAIAVSGVAGAAIELAQIFATELEHYEKVEGEPLSLEGKSNKLAALVRANFPLALQGLVIVPLFAGVEPRSGEPRIFEYDPVGGRYRATDHAAAGSGALTARATLKRFVDPDQGVDVAARVAVEALFEAAEEDSATGGPDLIRRIYPIVALIDADGYRELGDEAVAEHVEAVVEQRRR